MQGNGYMYYKTLVLESESDYESNLDYIRKYKEEKDQETLMWLIRNNARLIHKEVKPYLNAYGNKLEYDDLFSAGIEGLIKGIEVFDFSYNTRFSTYATHWIRQRIARTMVVEGFTVRIPDRMFYRINQVMKNEYGVEQGVITLNKEKICEDIAITAEAYEEAKSVYHTTVRPVSLNVTITDECRAELQDVLTTGVALHEVSMSLDPERFTIRNDLRRNLQEHLLSVLNTRELRIITRRYGLDGEEIKTQRGLSEKEGVSSARIGQIEREALRKLRVALQHDKQLYLSEW